MPDHTITITERRAPGFATAYGWTCNCGTSTTKEWPFRELADASGSGHVALMRGRDAALDTIQKGRS